MHCDVSCIIDVVNHLCFLFLCVSSSNGLLNDKFNHVNLCELKK
jgi:hypothetical protein